MIQEIVMHTEKSDIPNGYFYDTETSDFYVYRHKYTGREIHIAKNPTLYVNVKDYTNEVLDKIRAEIEQEKLDDSPNFCIKAHNNAVDRILQIIDKYKADKEQEGGNALPNDERSKTCTKCVSFSNTCRICRNKDMYKEQKDEN